MILLDIEGEKAERRQIVLVKNCKNYQNIIHHIIEVGRRISSFQAGCSSDTPTQTTTERGERKSIFRREFVNSLLHHIDYDATDVT